jgi:hypothetical protein
MAQTTTQVTQSCGEVEVNFNAACPDTGSWLDISGETITVSGTEQSRMVGDAYTLEGDTALTAAGKREPLDLVFTIVYTETDAEAYDQIRRQFETAECGALMCVRYSPRGGDAGEEQLTSARGVLTNFIYPALDASAGGVIESGFTLHTPFLTTAIIAS